MELAIVKYIKEHGLSKALEDFKLKVRVYDKKLLLKYDPLASPFGNREVEECRGLVLERDTWKVMSLGFTKFYNSAEGHAAKIDWSTARVLKKEDGCCHADTVLKTEDGDMTIKEICDTEYTGKVLSYDIESGEVVYDEIVAHSTKKNINNWYEIELEDGSTVKLTGNHKVWLPKLKCYRAVEDLTEDDEFLVLEK